MSEEKQITRTINTYHTIIKDAKEGKLLKEETTFTKPDRKKLAIAFIKETNNTNFTIDIEETRELRSLSLEDFLKYSSVVLPREK